MVYTARHHKERRRLTKRCHPKSGYTGTFPTLPTTLERVAVECAYPYGTPLKKYKYSGGTPKPAYKSHLNKAYPNRSGWKYAKSRAGASCDVFAGTCIRESGVDKKFDHALAKQIPYLKKHFTKVSKKKSGDILIRSNHIAIAVSLKGKLRMANAHYADHGGTYGIIQKMGSFTKAYRPKPIYSHFEKGDTFTEVANLQKFLKWYGEDVGTIDYVFGDKTLTAVKNFQYKEGLTVDGYFGAKALVKAKEVTK